MDVTCSAVPCPVILSSTCVFYTGANLIYTGITNNDNLEIALQKIDAKFQDAGLGYIFQNGIIQLGPGLPVGLGGSLLQDTVITGSYKLSLIGEIEASKLITTGGSSTQFVKGDGSLDSTVYQPTGNYISSLSGDGVASGPGASVFTLANTGVIANTYGSATRVPIITVDAKGRVTNLTTTLIAVPSSLLLFGGDVTGSGNTGSSVVLTLQTVNPSIYPSNTFLKFAVNGKGLVTSAAPVTNLDIESVLGYIPVPNTRTITINGITQNLAANRTWTLPGGGSVSFISVTPGTGIAASVTDPATTPNITITNTAPDQTVVLNNGTGISITGTYPNFTITATGGVIPDLQQVTDVGNVTTNSIVSAIGNDYSQLGPGAVSTGTNVGQDTSSLNPFFLDFNFLGKHSILNRNPNSEDSSLIMPNTNGIDRYIVTSVNGVYADDAGEVSIPVGTVTSVGLSMPTAFTVTNSPVTGAGTLTVTGAGTASQYVRGDGALAVFPSSPSGGGSSIGYYLNGSVAASVAGYEQLSRNPVFGLGTNYTTSTDGLIAQFLTDVGDPAFLSIPGGAWLVDLYFSADSAGGSPDFYVELYKYDGITFTLLSTNVTTPEVITNGTAVDLYITSLSVPTTTLTLTDRLAIRVYVDCNGKTLTLHTENDNLSQVITTFSTGIATLNGLVAQVQYFGVGTTGTDFNISSATNTHTFNLPTASATDRGALSSADWSTFNGKQNALTLTTTGSGAATFIADVLNIPTPPAPTFTSLTVTGDSGASTLLAGVLNVPTYTLAGLGGQPLATNLTSLSGLTYASTSFVKMTAAGTFALDTNTYLTSVGAGVTNELTYWSGTNTIGSLSTATYPSLTELSYVKGVTSSIQTQINNKFTLPSLTSGSVLFSNGTTIAQDNGNFFWDNTNKYLSIGTNLSLGQLHIRTASPTIIVETSSSTGTAQLNLSVNPLTGANTYFRQYGNSATGTFLGFANASSSQILQNDGTALLIGTLKSIPLIFGTNNIERARITNGGNLLVGTTTDAGFKLDVNGTGRFSGQILSTVSGNSALKIQQNSWFELSANDIISASGSSIIGGGTSGMGIRYSAGVTFGTGVIGYHYLTNNYALFSSQTSAVNLSSAVPASAVLEARSTTQGFLQPRMTTVQRDAIATPATGLQIYNTTTNTNQYYNGGGWASIDPLPSLTAGSVLFSNGTTISQDNSNFFWDDTNNRLGIGMAAPTNTLDVTGTARISSTTTLSSLSGVGSRMVVADATGVLSTTAIPSLIGYVPYTGATANVDLGAFGITSIYTSTTDGSDTVLINPTGIQFINTLPGDTIIQASNITGAYILELPDANGTFAVSANSVFADVYGNITLTAGSVGAEPALGNPSVSGYVLSSTTAGVRSWVAPAGAGSGITRSINNIAVNTTALAVASTDYVYNVTGTTTLTLPTAVGNTNSYKVKRIGTNIVTILFTSGQNADGSTTIILNKQYESLEFISDGTNWNIY